MLQGYYRPRTVETALDLLQEYQGRARIVAGGTDLVLQLRSRKVQPAALVDISAVDELRYISNEEDGRICVGALSTHTDLVQSDILHTKAPLLSRAASCVGSLQIRNVGTVGGNIVSAQPAADTAVALIALDARATIINASGKKELPVEQLYLAGGGSAIDPTREILQEITFSSPWAFGCGGGAFGRLSRRKALVLPVFNVAVVMRLLTKKGTLQDVRIVMAPVALVPVRANMAESYLKGSIPDEKKLEEASVLAVKDTDPRDSYFRGSAEYRKYIAGIMVRRTLNEVWGILRNRGC